MCDVLKQKQWAENKIGKYNRNFQAHVIIILVRIEL